MFRWIWSWLEWRLSWNFILACFFTLVSVWEILISFQSAKPFFIHFNLVLNKVQIIHFFLFLLFLFRSLALQVHLQLYKSEYHYSFFLTSKRMLTSYRLTLRVVEPSFHFYPELNPVFECTFFTELKYAMTFAGFWKEFSLNKFLEELKFEWEI